MIISRVAQRYAGAVYESVPETEREAFMADVNDMISTLTQSRELRLFFDSPIIERSKKHDVVDALCKDRFGDWMHRVLKLLVTKDREVLAGEILEALRNLHREAQGIRKVSVATALELGEELRNEIRTAMEQLAKGKVEIDYSTDTDLMGGVVVRMEDTVYDGSIRRQLARLRNKFMTAHSGA